MIDDFIQSLVVFQNMVKVLIVYDSISGNTEEMAVNQFGDYIKNETLADNIELLDGLSGGEAIELPGDIKVNIGVMLA